MLRNQKSSCFRLKSWFLLVAWGGFSGLTTFTVGFPQLTHAQESDSSSGADLEIIEPPAPEPLALEPEPIPAPLPSVQPEAIPEPQTAQSSAPAYEPEPVYKPEPSYQPVPIYEPDPAPAIIIGRPKPSYSPAPLKLPTPSNTAAPKANVAPEPSIQAPAQPRVWARDTPRGCAAQLNTSVPVLHGVCGGESNITSSPKLNPAPALSTVSEPTNSTISATTFGAETPSLPPARQLTRSPQRQAQNSPPPARVARLSSTRYSAPLPSSTPTVQPVQNFSPVPQSQQFASSSLTSPPKVSPTTRYTSFKPTKYSIKPITNPLKWVFKDQAMLFPLPIPVAVSSAFGWRMHPISGDWRLHSGVDFGAPSGTPVVAAYEGKVAIADYVGGYGLSVLLDHANGQRQTRYAHLSEIFVKPGQKVSRGDVIGAVGSTGNSTGPHLHFEALEATPEGMTIIDPTRDLKIALIDVLAGLKAPSNTQADPQQRVASTPIQDILARELKDASDAGASSSETNDRLSAPELTPSSPVLDLEKKRLGVLPTRLMQ